LSQHVLIVGAGSVGKRHARNLHALGCRISAFDPRADRLQELSAEMPTVANSTNFDTALGSPDLRGVVICSPPKYHVDQSMRALANGLPVLLEKPVSPDAASAARLARAIAASDTPLLLGYTYRWWQPLQDLRQRIGDGDIGRVLHTRCVLSAHLADWHPWERYQDFFMASSELGGGALLDESHFIDLLYWMFGMPDRVFGSVEKISDLEISSDDNVDATFWYRDGSRATMHLDLYGRPHERAITVVGSDGTLHWTFDPNAIRVGKGPKEWQTHSYTGERNDMFVGVAREFVQLLQNGRQPSCTAADGLAVLQIVEALRASSASGSVVSVG
jgi:predicted dehydrogenase